MRIDTLIFFQITDPKLYTYGVENPIMAIENLTATTLRNIIGELDLDETLTSREIINTKMRSSLDTATDPWGIKVNRVELKNIIPPQPIQEAMEKQMKAEREKREAILIAQGEKQSAITVAEGHKESAILEAEAEKQAAILHAEAQKVPGLGKTAQVDEAGGMVIIQIPGSVQLIPPDFPLFRQVLQGLFENGIQHPVFPGVVGKRGFRQPEALVAQNIEESAGGAIVVNHLIFLTGGHGAPSFFQVSFPGWPGVFHQLLYRTRQKNARGIHEIK